MDFAPYQSSPPEHARSPTGSYSSPRTSLDVANPRRSISSPFRPSQQSSPPPLQHPQPQRAWSGESVAGRYQSPLASNVWTNNNNNGYQDLEDQSGPQGPGRGGMGDYFGLGARRGEREMMVSEFDTSLGLRLDHEACLAYLVFPPLGAIVLLILERKSDYVR